MSAFIQPGNVLSLIAPAGGVVSGSIYLVGGVLAAAATTAAAGAEFSGVVVGVVSIPKASGQAWAPGDIIHWDATNGRGDSRPEVGPLAGVATDAAASSATTGRVRLLGAPQLSILTPEGGIATWMINKTGGASVKGQVVTAGGGVTRGAVRTTAGVPNAIGVIYDAGVAADGRMRVVTGGVAEVLFADGQAPTVGYWVGSSDLVDGRARAAASLPDNSGAGVTMHNHEMGHCLETKQSGTDVLALCVLHFN